MGALEAETNSRAAGLEKACRFREPPVNDCRGITRRQAQVGFDDGLGGDAVDLVSAAG